MNEGPPAPRAELAVEVAYARPDQQVVLSLKVRQGMRLGEIIRSSGLLERFPEIDLTVAKIGVFGRRRTLDELARAGDRIEVYRPLQADPKESRRRRAAARDGLES
ncbi:RnfH family protein [Acidihalobacter ferrooxydans]|uniref:UPF0125 protein BW247_03240 n=1 Tax=Acidihalobacter ferrooxydans TaxID=1765967 RepID=A0A1P8UL22_9GAMM|nr:RnfH family protein [Acidihalobacter ferrooxydans]APZ44519.1 RnfH family protein [Acidihalobacter ferrooxydans]